MGNNLYIRKERRERHESKKKCKSTGFIIMSVADDSAGEGVSTITMEITMGI